MAVANRAPKGANMTDTTSHHSAGTAGSQSGSPTPMWPSLGDFCDAIQNPKACFLDPHLRECEVERKGPAKTPWVRSGAFAGVFKLEHPSGRATAVRVFAPQRLDPEKEERLIQIASHLSGLGAKRPSFLVDYRYEAQGIRIKGDVYPIQTMDWVKGITLGNWYQARMRAKDVSAIKAMAAHWQKLVLGLRAVQIAHGDLQHGNVMVRDDNTPVLVDYDGMCVPGLVDDPPRPCFEFGLKGYVHPARESEGLGPNLDHFPAWVILIALRASAAEPGLFRRFVDEPENENMLFSPADMANPATSKLWPELLKCPDSEVRAWAAELRASLDRPFALIPPFQTDPFSTLVELCAAPVPNWEAIQVEADRITTGGKVLPATLASALHSKVATARKKVASRTALQTALKTARDTGDPRPVVAVFDPSIYADWPKHEGLVKQATRVIARGKLLTDLESAARTSTDGRLLLTLWDRTKDELADCPLAQEYGEKAEAWRSRIEAADEFLAAFAVPSQTESVLADAWNKVTSVGQPHPSLTATHRERGVKAVARAPRLVELRSIPAPPAPPTEQNDWQLIRLWDEALFKGCQEAAAFPARVAAAKARLAAVAKVTEAVRLADAGTGPETAVVAAAASLPANYTYDLRNRVALAREGEEQLAGLKNILNGPTPSDVAIAGEWEKVQRKHPKHAALLDPARRALCERAVRRRKTLRDLDEAINGTTNAYEQDRILLTVWAAGRAEMKGSTDVARLSDRIKLALTRTRAWEALDKAVRSQDLANIRAAYSPPDLPKFAQYPPVALARPQIEDLIRLATWLDDLRVKLENASQATGLLLTSEDLENLKRHGAKLEPATREAVMHLLRTRLWPAIKVTPAAAPPQITPGPLPMAKVRWTWNGPDLVSWFDVATAPGPLTDPSAAARDRISRCRPADHAREGGGKLVVLGSGSSVTVTIWPVLDLGWATLSGPPVHIGPIRGGR